MTRISTLALCTAVLLMAVTPAHPQDFGRNKVQYDSFNFAVLSSPGFRVHYYPAIEEAAVDATRLLERWNDRLSELFDHTLSSRVPVVLYASGTDFAQTNILPGLIPAGVGGVTESRQGRIIMPLSGVYGELDHVLGHELVHAYHFDLLGRVGDSGSIPLWLVEGMAEYATLGRVHAQTTMWLREQAITSELPTIRQISRNPTYSPYRYGHAIWAYIGHRYGDRVAFDFYKEVLRSGFGYAASEMLGTTIDELSDDWQEFVTEHVLGDLPESASPDTDAVDLDSDIVVSPVLSPDGRYAAVFSREDVFNLDLYLVDVDSGETVRRLARNQTSPHFDALRFIDSAGAFSPDGEAFAFVAEREGDNAVVIVDVETGRVQRTIAPRQIEAISSLAWSPDGNTLVLSATAGGVTDLYRYGLDDGQVDRLTNDRYAELHPAYSPDGSRLAFTTDRPLDGAPMRLQSVGRRGARIGVLDVDSREVRVLAIHPQATHTNPAFTSDGEKVIFVADPNGVPNVYTADLQGGNARRVTNVATGVSGFTALSPSISLSSARDRLAVTVYEDGGYRLHVIDDAVAGATSIDPGDMSYKSGAALTPDTEGLRARVVGEEGPAIDEADLSRRDYRPTLRLSSVGRALVGVSANAFGTSLFATVSASFEDMLGNHTVLTTAQVAGSVRDVGAGVLYMNTTQRLEWGLSGEHIATSVSQTVSGGTDIQTPEGTLTVENPAVVTARSFTDRVGVRLEWPFSPAVRAEAAFSYLRIADELEIEEASGSGGRPDATYIYAVDRPLHLANNELAAVVDTSFSGFTGPLRGTRARLSVSPVLGSLTFLSVRADMRGYGFLRPVGIAGRIVHLGRYLGDADSEVLSPLSIGSPALVRGYEPSTIRSFECSTEDCPEYDRLFGTKLLAANVELRLPVLGAAGLGLVSFPFLPATIVAFADAGIAWSDWVPWQFTLDAVPGVPTPIVSTGLSLRLNLANAVILELSYAWPFAREEVPSIFGLALQPGF